MREELLVKFRGIKNTCYMIIKVDDINCIEVLESRIHVLYQIHNDREYVNINYEDIIDIKYKGESSFMNELVEFAKTKINKVGDILL